METSRSNIQSLFSPAGYLSLIGALCMLAGAALWGASGTDLWATLGTNQMESYLTEVALARPLLVANTCFWVLGVILMGSAGTMMAQLCADRQGIALVAKVCMRTAVPVAIVSFLTMLSLAIQVAPDTSPASVTLASTIGWIGARLDDIATFLIVGAGPLLLSVAGYGTWVSAWLRVWGYLAGLAGVVSVAGSIIKIDSPLTFIIIPFGIGWMIAAGVVLIKKKH